jgi:hypothetical protein
VTYAILVESQKDRSARRRMERKLNPSEETWQRMLERARTEREAPQRPKYAPGVAEAMRAFGRVGG